MVKMDIRNRHNTRTYNFKLFDEITEFDLYDYEREGIMNKTLPKILFKGNTIFVSFLQLIDTRIIMLFKYIDKLKRFKWVTWY